MGNGIGLTQEEILFKQYELVVRDEHYFRDTFQNRVNFRFTVIMGLVAGIVLLVSKKEQNHIIYFTLEFLSILIAYISYNSIDAIERISEHFMESIYIRELLEIKMGMRKPEDEEKPEVNGKPEDEEKPEVNGKPIELPSIWPNGLGYIYEKKWAKRIPPSKNGERGERRFISLYYKNTVLLFNGFTLFGIISLVTFFVLWLIFSHPV